VVKGERGKEKGKGEGERRETQRGTDSEPKKYTPK
jgi:hypothetical protein